MSRIYSAAQYEHDYLPHRLGNWEVPSSDKLQRTTAATRFSTVRPRSGKTSFIVDERGHLLPGVKKIPNAFNTVLKPYEKAPPRWPQPSPTVRSPPAATLGYKGIITDYLPTNTVMLKTVMK